MIQYIIDTKSPINELIASFIEKGGRIDKYYLLDQNKGKHATIYLNGWFGGKNIREALLKALA